MQVSAEIRWFWPKRPPDKLHAWFCDAGAHPFAAGGGGKRIDEYLLDSEQIELGIKRRDGKRETEVKGLVSVMRDGLSEPPFTGTVELWTKWTTKQLDLKPHTTISTIKQRWLRKFDLDVSPPREIEIRPDERPLKEGSLPDRGCNVELTGVTLSGGAVWWTLGFEAFGTIETVRQSLASTAKTLAARRPPPLGQGSLASYPAWLKDRASTK